MRTHNPWAGVAGLLLIVVAAGCEPAPTASGSRAALHADEVAADAVPAQTVTARMSLPVDFVSAEPCAGENIHYTGTIEILFHVTNNRGLEYPADGSQIYIDNEHVDLTGVGLTTGRAYSVDGVQRFAGQSESPDEAFPSNIEFVRETVLSSPGLGAIGLTTIRILVVVSATGETAVGSFHLETRCL
jgi:hypothetical protein